jgi:hypothetical protein
MSTLAMPSSRGRSRPPGSGGRGTGVAGREGHCLQGLRARSSLGRHRAVGSAGRPPPPCPRPSPASIPRPPVRRSQAPRPRESPGLSCPAAASLVLRDRERGDGGPGRRRAGLRGLCGAGPGGIGVSRAGGGAAGCVVPFWWRMSWSISSRSSSRRNTHRVSGWADDALASASPPFWAMTLACMTGMPSLSRTSTVMSWAAAGSAGPSLNMFLQLVGRPGVPGGSSWSRADLSLPPPERMVTARRAG